MYELDENYYKKFGLLKKASMLSLYGRHNEAMKQLGYAAKIVQEQKKHEVTMHEAIQNRWRFKLGLDNGFEFPKLDKVHPDDINYKKEADEMNTPGLTEATLRIYV